MLSNLFLQPTAHVDKPETSGQYFSSKDSNES